VLELEEVVRYYRSAEEEVRAVDGVSLQVLPGELVALQGPSGSGKTTLLMLIAALLRPERGTIRFAGRDVGALTGREASDYLMHEVGFVYQRFHLQPRTSALDNASLGLILAGRAVGEAQAMAQDWLERVGLSDRMNRVPEQMSGGERQRVALARALASDPRLILADEPTGNLDSARSREVIELLRSVAYERQAAVLLVTHDSEIAALADRRCTMRDGKLTHDPEQPERTSASASLRATSSQGSER
jgi:putative ABC transport system ATP-binding protein